MYDELCDCIGGDKFNGASTFWHSGNHTGIIVFYRMESDERKLVCYAHEKRHLEDHILEYLGIHDIETAGYISGWMAPKFSELYHAKTKTSWKWYHGTSQENWAKIQEEGILFGKRHIIDSNGNIVKKVDRYTYLAVDKNAAKQYGDVVLEVEYNPFDADGEIRKDEKGVLNNYNPESEQIRVYEPISIDKLRIIWTNKD